MNQPINNQSNRSDDWHLLIQKLVDGELDHPARSNWLAGLTEDSALWRDLALAFVEKQITEEALSDFPVADSPITNDFKRSSESVGIPSSTSLNTDPSPSRSWIVMGAIGLASCLLAGIFIGSEITTSPTEAVVVQKIDTSKPLENPTTENGDPNVAIGLADALSRSAAPVPIEFRRALLRAGYSLKDKRTITNVSLPNGGQIELPVRDVNVTYVGLSSFQ